MKNNILKHFFIRILPAAALLLTAAGCKQTDVDLPLSYLRLTKHSILSSAFPSTYTLSVESNCAWKLTFTDSSDGSDWVTLSTTGETGLFDLQIAVTANTGNNPRSFTLRATSSNNSTLYDELHFVQASSSADGYITITEARTLAADGDFTVSEDMKLRGFVVSDREAGNYYKGHTALQSGREANCGISLHYGIEAEVGSEVELELKGAVIGADPETGVIEVRPATGAAVYVTQTEPVAMEPLHILSDEFETGAYESMYVSVHSQIVEEDLGKMLSQGVTMETGAGLRFGLEVSPECSFANEYAFGESGNLRGIVGRSGGVPTIMPTAKSDYSLMKNMRFMAGVGIELPYVVSFMVNNQTNGDCKYGQMNVPAGCPAEGGAGYSDNISFTMTDDSCASLTAVLTGNKDLRHWADGSGHHNIYLGGFQGSTTSDFGNQYILLTLPVKENIAASGLRLSMGLCGAAYAPAHWTVKYSMDGENWYATDAKMDIATDQTVGSSKNFFYYQFDFTPAFTFEVGSTLFIRIQPYDNVAINAKAIGGNNARLHSAVVLERTPSFSTPRPEGAVFFEPFDECTTGVDYLLGDRLAGLINFCGDAIERTNGISYANVYSRPGYAQIGFVESQTVAHTARTMTEGWLQTPALKESGTLKLTFKTMAFNNTSLRTSAALEYGGDSQTMLVEILGGGTVGSQTSTTLTGISYTGFEEKTLTIENATPDTQIRFSGVAGTGSKAFTRLFIDDICVTKQ